MSAVSASPAVGGRSPSDPVRALQHALYRAAKADPGRRFHALRDKVFRRDVLWRAWVEVRRNDGAPGIDQTTLADVEEYGVARLLDELATDLREGRYRPLPARRVFIPKPGSRRAAAVDPDGPGPDRAGRGEDRARADLRGRHAGVLVRVPPETVGARRLQVLIDESWRGRRWVVGDGYRQLFRGDSARGVDAGGRGTRQ